MAQVIKNADNTLTVTLTPMQFKVLQRWAADTNKSVAAIFEDVINGFITNKLNDYHGVDGPQMRAKYEALTPTQQAQIDTILG